jgi:integrase
VPRPRLARPAYRLKRRGEVWNVTWTDPDSGRTRAVSTRATERAAAEIWRDQWIAGAEQPLPPKEPTIAEILDGYVDARKGRVEAHDRLEYASAAIKRHVGNLQPRMLGPRTYHERRASERVADGTIRREISVLRAALNWAMRQQPAWIDRAPHVERPSKPPPRERWLSKDEVRRLIEGCGAAHVRMFVMLAYHTAARPGAIFELTWNRTDLNARRIDYQRPGRSETKKRRASVPINAPLLAELQAARAVATIDQVIEFRGKPIASVKKGFAEACRRAGIVDCSPYVLRHTAATHMVIAGVPLAEIARMLGDSEAMVERVYGKHSPDYLRRAADALAGDLQPRLVFPTLSEKPKPPQGTRRG